MPNQFFSLFFVLTNIYLRTQTSYKQLRSDVKKKKINIWCLWYTPKTGGGGVTTTQIYLLLHRSLEHLVLYYLGYVSILSNSQHPKKAK